MPARELLLAQGALLSYHDPYVDDWEVEAASPVKSDALLEAAGASDLVVLVQNHSGFDLRALSGVARRFLDLRGALDEPGVERL